MALKFVGAFYHAFGKCLDPVHVSFPMPSLGNHILILRYEFMD